MEKIILFYFLFYSWSLFAQTNRNNFQNTPSKKLFLIYDTKTLKIQGNSLPIGLMTINSDGDTIKTKGFLKGKQNWNKYNIQISNGKFFLGKIKIGGDFSYKKLDSIEVNIYSRKWFLGKKCQLVLTKKIPYNYEKEIQLKVRKEIVKAPGKYIQFGIRTIYNNDMFIDSWGGFYSNDLLSFNFNEEGCKA